MVSGQQSVGVGVGENSAPLVLGPTLDGLDATASLHGNTCKNDNETLQPFLFSHYFDSFI